jgi:hypothetical protein
VKRLEPAVPALASAAEAIFPPLALATLASISSLPSLATHAAMPFAEAGFAAATELVGVSRDGKRREDHQKQQGRGRN